MDYIPTLVLVNHGASFMPTRNLKYVKTNLEIFDEVSSIIGNKERCLVLWLPVTSYSLLASKTIHLLLMVNPAYSHSS